MQSDDDGTAAGTIARFREIDLEKCDIPDIRAAMSYWEQKRGSLGRIAPAWSELDLTELPPKLIPRVCVVNVSDDGPDFRYRFWGSAITDMHHYDLTGKSVRTLTPEHYAECIWRQYKCVLDAGRPLCFITEVPLDDGRITYYVAARLPLSTDGNTIDMIMSAEDYGSERKQLADLFEAVWRERSD